MGELEKVFGSAEQLWQYIEQSAFTVGRGMTRVILELYYVMKSPHTPALDKTLIIAALGYQLLPNDRKLLSREKYGLLGLIDNGAALALAYSRVKVRVTPQIEAQVETILNQWFGVEQLQLEDSTESSQWSGDNRTRLQTVAVSVIPNQQKTPLGAYNDDEDVVID